MVRDTLEVKYQFQVLRCSQGEEGQGWNTPVNLQWHFGYRYLRDEVVM